MDAAGPPPPLIVCDDDDDDGRTPRPPGHEPSTGGIAGRQATLPHRDVDGALPPPTKREPLGGLPRFLNTNADLDAPYMRPSVSSRRRLYDYATGPSSICADSDLGFESRFESGNLLSADRLERRYLPEAAPRPSPSGEPWPDQEYDLQMHPDVGTAGHTQWFYFEVRRLKAATRYRFNLTNFSKTDSLYLEGMQPLL